MSCIDGRLYTFGIDYMSSDSISLFLSTFRNRLRGVLRSGVADRGINSELYLYDIMSYTALASCKFLRPLFIYQSFLSLSYEKNADPEILMPFAISVELMHVNTLLLDDLPAMDNDDFRRGKPSCHRVYGEDKAILAASGLLALAFGIVVRAESCAYESRCEIVDLLSNALGVPGVVGGQYLDIGVTESNEELLLRISEKKTACLFSVACEIATIIACSTNFREDFREFGRCLGMAFQIKDDIKDCSSGKDRNNVVVVLGMDKAKSLLGSYLEIAVNIVQKLDIPSPSELLKLVYVVDSL